MFYPLLLAQLAVLGLSDLRWERWALPLLPLFALAGGIGAAWVVQIGRERAQIRTALLLTALVLALLPLSLASFKEARARTNDTRQLASDWAVANIPDGSTVLIEHFAFDLFDQDWKVLFPLGDTGCVEAHDVLAGRIDYGAVEAARGSRSTVDFGTTAPAKRASCDADFAILVQMDRYRVEQDRFPDEYAAYRSLSDRMEVREIFRPVAGEREGPVVNILVRKPKGEAAP